jgi:hypothetical protein
MNLINDTRRILGESVIEEKSEISGTTIYKTSVDDMSNGFEQLSKDVGDRDIELTVSGEKIDQTANFIKGTFSVSFNVDELIFVSGNVKLSVDTSIVEELSISKRSFTIFLNNDLEISGTF